jgi:hypothetical protein
MTQEKSQYPLRLQYLTLNHHFSVTEVALQDGRGGGEGEIAGMGEVEGLERAIRDREV